MTERLHFHFSLSCIGEGNGNPLQCSCLENPMGRGAWWAAIYGVAQSRTQLKRLSSSSSICISEVIDISPSNPDSSCASSSSAFHMMYSAYKLNKQGDNIQPWCTPFPIWNQSVVPCVVLTVASWPEYRFLSRQIRLSSILFSWRIFNSFLWSTVKGFGVVNKAEVADLPVSAQKSLAEVWVDGGQPWVQEHSIQQSWEPCWHKPIWKRSSLLPLSLP